MRQRILLAVLATVVVVAMTARAVIAQSPLDRVTIVRPGPAPAAGPVAAAKPLPIPHRLSLVAAIIEADVVSVREAYDPQTGPRTIATLGNVLAHAGNAPATLEVSQLAGHMPDGSGMTTSIFARLSPGSRYIFFWIKDSWLHSPIVAQYYYRVETIGQKRVVLDPSGLVVRAFSETGVVGGDASLLAAATDDSPSTPVPLRSVQPTDPDVALGLSAAQFITDAIQATNRIGGAFGAKLPETPDTSRSWTTPY